MIAKYLSAMWTAVAPALGNHLWQSTLFAVAAGLLTLVLRQHQARTRYWLWLAASVKFLIPFSWLIAMGSHLAFRRISGEPNAGLYLAIEQVSQPFAQAVLPAAFQSGASTAFSSLIHALPALLAALWLGGFLVVLGLWFARWRRVSAALRGSVPLTEGREVEILRNLERTGVTRKRIEMVASRSSLEPGIFGIAQPVLLWPEGISHRLEDAHLEAILAHELWHVRRRDNLAAAMHMVVEALFWFHPLVWWLGARLVEERERACDEEVLEQGSEPQVYAESILKVCEFCVGSTLACVAGVTGADLKRRMVHIMAKQASHKLDWSRRLLLGAAGLLTFAVPIAFGVLNPTPSQAENTADPGPRYESISIQPSKANGMVHIFRLMNTPGGLSARGITLRMLIREAYGVEDGQISGAPDWLDSEKYDVEAKMDKSAADELKSLSEDQRARANHQLLQALLTDRFKLTLHRKTKDLPVYFLVVAGGGPKLQEAKTADAYEEGIKDPGGQPGGPGKMMMQLGGGELRGQALPMAELARLLAVQLRSPVLDKTGLTGSYDFLLLWKPAAGQGPMLKAPEGGTQDSLNPPQPESSGPSIFTAIQEQLGLELKAQISPVQTLIIDHAEAPAEN